MWVEKVIKQQASSKKRACCWQEFIIPEGILQEYDVVIGEKKRQLSKRVIKRENLKKGIFMTTSLSSAKEYAQQYLLSLPPLDPIPWALLAADSNESAQEEALDPQLFVKTLEQSKALYQPEMGSQSQLLNADNQQPAKVQNITTVTAKVQEIAKNSKLKDQQGYSTSKLWTKEHDAFLTELVQKKTEKRVNWQYVAYKINKKFFAKPETVHRVVTPKGCRNRFTRSLDSKLIKAEITVDDIHMMITLLKTGKYFKGGDIESLDYRGIRYASLARALSRPDHLVRATVFEKKICSDDPYFYKIRQVEHDRIGGRRLMSS